MARIISIEKDTTNISNRKNLVDVKCLYEVSRLQNGEKCVVLKTFNPRSKTKGISQVIHITKDKANEIINILKKEFDL